MANEQKAQNPPPRAQNQPKQPAQAPQTAQAQQQGPIEEVANFDYVAFSKDLTAQAAEVIPTDLTRRQKSFITDIILRFCTMAGEALSKTASPNIDLPKATLITQFIGEWIFHKSIDLIRSGIDEQFWEPVLQRVAFTVFEIAQKAMEADLPQEQLITLVENHVKKSFEAAIVELQKKGAISAELSQNAMSQSNIDVMAAAEVQDEVNRDIACMSDTKILKLASLAVLMKNFSSEKMKSILSKFNKPERDVLISYLKMPDLEEKVDMKATMKCLEEMKNALPDVGTVSFERAHKRMCKIVKNSDKNIILDIIKEERPALQEFVLGCYKNKKRKIPAYIADAVSKYLEEKIS